MMSFYENIIQLYEKKIENFKEFDEKKLDEISEKVMKEGKEDTEKEKKILERLKKQGLFTKEIITKF